MRKQSQGREDKGTYSGLPLRAKTAQRLGRAKLLAPGLAGARRNPFWVYFWLKSARVRRSKKMAVFFTVEGPIFGHFSPNLDLRRPKCRENYGRPCFRPLSGHFSGGKFWYHVKKKLARFWARREARFAICPFFLRKNIFRPALFLSRLERPKRPPNAPGLVSVAAAVLWQHYFHRRPPTAPPARRSREALVHWFGSVHTAHRPAVGCVLCQGVLPGPV